MALGFTVAADARHPFGTGNCCIFFENGTYLEPITILDRNAADVAASEGLFFVKRLKRFTERHGEGFAMLALRSADADADRQQFEAAGISAGPTFRFSRNASLADGSETEIGVALAYAASEAAPDATFFACQRIGTEALFAPAHVTHRNTAAGVAAVTMVANEPASFGDLVAAAVGAEPDRVAGDGVEAADGPCPVSILTPERFRTRYGVAAPDPRRGLRLAAFDLLVSDLDEAARCAGTTAHQTAGMVVIPPAPGQGAVIALRKKNDE